MDKVLISNSQGESGIVNVVRYFKNNGVDYLIYSLNEVDEAGYTRLYVTKLNGTDGVYNADTLNDNEWNEVKNLVKVIVKANKEGVPAPIEDLNPKKINNVFLKDKKVFKLNASLVTDLASNKPSFNVEQEQKIETPVESSNSFEQVKEPSYEQPVAPSFETPVQPTFDFNAQPSFDAMDTNVPSFETPSVPSFDIPSAPSFDMPSMPSFETPVKSNESQTTSSFDFNAQPPFDIPAPNTSSFKTPNIAPFEVPSASTEPQTTPTYDFNAQPSFEVPIQPSFDFSNQQTFESQTTPTFDFGTQSQKNESNNYQELYNNALAKNESMQQEINKLNDELAKYKNIISNLKNIIEE